MAEQERADPAKKITRPIEKIVDVVVLIISRYPQR
jgi:hypothetical protein